MHCNWPIVALRKESVDRNSIALASIRACITSLSARRAWIEILAYPDMIICTKSLSARRAWIEMANALPITSPITKSLSARRAWIEINVGFPIAAFLLSLSARRAWIEMIKFCAIC